MAALLTGDTATAEAVVLDAFTDLHDYARASTRDSVARLRRLVVTRSRRAAHRHHRHGGQHQVTQFGDSAVVAALRALPFGQREAVVLTLYLDLSDEQAAAAMVVSPATLRRHLSAAKAALRPTLSPRPMPPAAEPPV